MPTLARRPGASVPSDRARFANGDLVLCRILLLTAGLLLGACDETSSERQKGKRNEKLDASPGEHAGDPVRVGVAASMFPAVEDLKPTFERKYPDIELHLESGGSNALVRKLTELLAPFDMLVLADVRLFEVLEKRGWTNRVVSIAGDRMVLAHGPQNEDVALSPDTWAQAIRKPKVRFGIADPAQAPLGYRSLIVLQLEERRSKMPGFTAAMQDKFEGRFVWPHATALAAHLEAGELDYALLYSSTATELRLEMTELAPEVNLGSAEHADDYDSAKVRVPGPRPDSERVLTGEPISYGAALAENRSRPAVVTFFELLVGKPGKRALRERGFSPKTSQ